MALPSSGLVEQMSQLDAARNLVLGDAAFYPQIVSGIIPIIGPSSRLELRRWGAEFLAETFASPAFAEEPKQKLSTEVLHVIQELLDIPGGDVAVIRSTIQAAASMYGLVFRHVYVAIPPITFTQEPAIRFSDRARACEQDGRSPV